MLTVPLRVFPNGEGLELPSYQTAGSAGCDLRAAVEQPVHIPAGELRLIPTGIGLALPEGHEAQVRPRSGLALKHCVTVLNAPGTIDADYRGEIRVPLFNHGREAFVVSRGDRIAQLVVAPVLQVRWSTVNELGSTERGGAGFGSTGT